MSVHLTMTGPHGELVYHLECTLAQGLEIAQGNRGKEALAITESATRQCYACRAWGEQSPVTLHDTPHTY